MTLLKDTLMALRKLVISVLVCLMMLSISVTTRAQLSFARTKLRLAPSVSSQATALAVLNNQTITLDDLEPTAREIANRLESEIALARSRVLTEQIEAVLFEIEAKRRRVSVDRLLDIEVARKIGTPTASQIEAIYNANRSQFGNTDLATARPGIVAYLRRENAEKLLTDFAALLRKRLKVVMGTDLSSPNLAPATTVATVAGRPVLAGPIIERLKPIIYDLRFRVYEAVKNAVEQVIYNTLVLEEARRRGVGPEIIIRKEITEKLHGPTEAEITKFYEENKARINADLSTFRGTIVTYLEEQERKGLELALNEKLRKGANIRLLIEEPQPPVLAISTDDDPSRGPANAPVTVVVFTDFQCPNCGANHPIIDEVTKSFGNSVRLVIRDFPLEMHENARRAAEAANAANAQGKFFEYMDLLFKNQKALDVAGLKKYATELGLNRARFDAALDSGEYQAEVNHDIKDGFEYGVRGTPTVFVNGMRVNNLSAETLRMAIDRALAQKKTSGAPSPAGTAN